eukprot:CAMPEP_0171307220 /NCGR_PEP_ID=MMETSP0816-20121228/17230_1 /TAXON_ID=420281 /ORGANISM="Proboscia inermis, Strain CCAP1064/1" /LENGTH=149 /DNA_ID=CAMNT_0011789249 /DNA_START=123 /DNA_END=572 /DNA_ORIENTATION=+
METQKESSNSTYNIDELRNQDEVPKIIRIYSGDDGQSHLERVPLKMSPFVDKEGANGLASPLEKCRGVSFRVSPPGYKLSWHCAPRRQYVIQMEGYIEIECGDGNKIVAGPGDVLLAEDFTGQGHTTKVVGNQNRVYVVVRLEEDDDMK